MTNEEIKKWINDKGVRDTYFVANGKFQYLENLLLEFSRDKVKNNVDLANVMPSLSDFKESRTEKGLTLRQVEKLTGISNAYLSQLETGKIKSPSFNVVKKLYDLYNGT